MIRDIFDKIASSKSDEFTFEEYMEALKKDPKLFVWLEHPKEMLNDILNEQEGQYTKKFVDETLDLMFRYIATTEYAFKRIEKLTRQINENGESEDGK
jgi:hypothetical protein